jgi:Holliday junction resolvase RusA-like endonuclease
LDNLQGIAYVNDRQIVEIHARRFDDKANPRVEVIIEEVQGGVTNSGQ